MKGNMAVKRRSLFSFCCLLAVFPIVLAQRQGPIDKAPGLVISARPVKRNYHKGEKVILDVRVRNEGKRSLLLAPLSVVDEYLQVRVFGPDGEKAPQCSDKIDGGGLAEQKFLIVYPGASVHAPVRLSCEKRGDRGYVLDRIGKYVVHAEYHVGLPRKALNEIAGTAEVWNGRIEAPPAEFSITSLENKKGAGPKGDRSSPR